MPTMPSTEAYFDTATGSLKVYTAKGENIYFTRMSSGASEELIRLRLLRAGFKTRRESRDYPRGIAFVVTNK